MSSLIEIQAYIRVAAAQGRETVRVGPFLATFDLGSALVYLSYAIPDDGAAPSASEVSSLIAAYRSRERVPRLEYMAALAPAVEPTLLASGFVVEARVPMMVCDPSSAVPQPVPAGIELVVPETDAEIEGYLRTQREAFGEDPTVSPADIAGMRGRNGLRVLARDTATGEPAGAGAGTAVIGGSTELVGLGVRESYRRRGIAAAITWELSRLADRAGVTTAFLTPGEGVAERVYARVGYRGMGEMLHISHPGAA